MDALVTIENLCIDLPVLDADSRSLKKAVLQVGRSGGRLDRVDGGLTVRAIDGVSVTLYPGDRLALVGHNGAGKTTLLRTMAGVYQPRAGSVEMNGTVGTLFDLALGLSLESTGNENIRLRALFESMPPAEIEAWAEQVGEFTELGSYLDMPARTYSAGMLLRLGFAMVTALRSDILLMDEWLSVGDAEFTAKADARLQEMVTDSKVLVLATHSASLVERLCNKALLLDHGRVSFVGDVGEALSRIAG